MLQSSVESIAVPVFISIAASAVSGVLGGLVIWWRKSAVEEANAKARDQQVQEELGHFRRETDRVFADMKAVMNGFGGRLDGVADRQGRMYVALFGPTEKNGLHGDVKRLVQEMAALTAQVVVVQNQYTGMVQRVAEHGHELQGIGRRLKAGEG